MRVVDLLSKFAQHIALPAPQAETLRCLPKPAKYLHPGKWVLDPAGQHQLFLLIANRSYTKNSPLPSLVEVINRCCKFRPLAIDIDQLAVTEEELQLLRELTAKFLGVETRMVPMYVCHSPPKLGVHIVFPHRALPRDQHAEWLAEIHKQLPHWVEHNDERGKKVGLDTSIYRSGLRMVFCEKEERVKLPFIRIIGTTIDRISDDDAQHLTEDERLEWLENSTVSFFENWDQLDNQPYRPVIRPHAASVVPAAAATATTVPSTTAVVVATADQLPTSNADSEDILEDYEWIVKIVRKLVNDPTRSCSVRRAANDGATMLQFPAHYGELCPTGSGKIHENAAGGYHVLPGARLPALRCHSASCKGFRKLLLRPEMEQTIVSLLRTRFNKGALDKELEIITQNRDDNDPRYVLKSIGPWCFFHKKHETPIYCKAFLDNAGMGWICSFADFGVAPLQVPKEQYHGGLKTTEQRRLRACGTVDQPVYQDAIDPKRFIMVRGELWEREGWDMAIGHYRVRPWGHREQARVHFKLQNKQAFEDWENTLERVDLVAFRPDVDALQWVEKGQSYFNSFQGWTVTELPFERIETVVEKCQVVLTLIRDSICNGDSEKFEYLLNYLAHLFQKPADKPGVAIVLQSDIEGVGKGTIFQDLLQRIVPRVNYSYVGDSNVLESQFNDYLLNCLVCFIDEGFWGGDQKIAGKLRSLITAPTDTLNLKHKDLMSCISYTRFIIASNQYRVVPASPTDRRYAMFKITEIKDRAYFEKVHDFIRSADGPAAFFTLLMNRDLSNFKPTAMPLDCVDQTWIQAIHGGLDSVQAWLHAELGPAQSATGEIPCYLPSQRHRRDCVYNRYINHRNAKRKLNDSEFSDRLANAFRTGGIKEIREGHKRFYEFSKRSVLRLNFEKALNKDKSKIKIWDMECTDESDVVRDVRPCSCLTTENVVNVT